MTAPPPALVASVRALVERHQTPLARKVRAAAIGALVDELIALDPHGDPRAPRHRAALVLRATHIAHRHDDELHRLERRWQLLEHDYLACADDGRRRALLADHLADTVADRAERRRDLAALDRALDLDALRERHMRARQHRLAALEVILAFAGAAAAAALVDAGVEPGLDAFGGASRPAERDDLYADLVRGRLDAFLRDQGEHAPRWTLRRLALDGLARLVHAAPAAARADLEAAHLGAALRCAGEDGHPWVQGAALALVVALSRAVGDSLLARRLLDDTARAPRDFLVRRQIVDLLATLGDDAAHALLVRAARGGDPSEHVRLGLAAAFVRCPSPAASYPPLRALAGLDPAAAEPSPRVRAATVAAVCRAGLDAAAGHPIAPVAPAAPTAPAAPAAPTSPAALGELALTLAEAVLERDDHPLPLAVAGDDAAALLAARPDLVGAAPSLLAALLRLSARADRPPAVHEAAAAAAERIAGLLDPARAAWAAQVAAAVAAIPAGGRASLARTAPGLPPLDDARLGRILAALSRSGLGLSATRRGDHVILRRGDRFARRLWRLLHELRTPAPNKRQAHLHSVGRRLRGELRAPPGGMAEVTATAVPGERVHVAAEGGWGRHLPTVDDLLDLPLTGAAVAIYSSHGVTTVTPPRSLLARLRNRLSLARRYRDLADLRTAALAGDEPRQRERYLADVAARHGITAGFARHDYPQPTSIPDHVRTLFSSASPTLAGQSIAGGSLTGRALALAPLPLADWADRYGYYVRSLHENGQTALALFAGGLAGLFFVDAYRKRRRIDRARRRIPLSIGGWGTRGKSGTERLKAAVLHGLGHEVFVKTTGCEAMFIHAAPDQAAHEIFIFRSYDKATIWEQRDMLELAADLGCDAFLWECMALNPQFVELLQRDWMRDDLVTLTNAFPDHEDVQGPAGIDVATCISSFIPDRSTLYTSEHDFLPLFADRCATRDTALIAIPPRDADLLADDLLALFPYSEHPRNIALVARLADDLGIDRHLAIATMAEHVVPDLGVLKTYPPARVRGRVLSFINGMSANERTGFLNNWQRTGLDAIAADDPGRAIVTVVNNRWDRVSRSEVFARILVEDAVADAHVLIGSNLRGLRSYIDAALARLVADMEVVVAADLDELGSVSGDGHGLGDELELPFLRLERLMARLRIPPPAPAHAMRRLHAWATGAQLAISADAVAIVEAAGSELLAPPLDASLSLARIRRDVDQRLAALPSALLAAPPQPATVTPLPDAAPPEVLAPASPADLADHLARFLTRLTVHARLRARLAALVARRDRAAIAPFHATLRTAYRELFTDALIVVDDVSATGDQVIDRCARAVPPGTDVAVMGIQNIKGTGLDFVYRWLAHDQTTARLAELASPDRARRLAALRGLEAFEDYGLVDAGTAAAALAGSEPARAATHAHAHAAVDAQEALARARALRQVVAIHDDRRRALDRGAGPGRLGRLFAAVEAVLDPVDSVLRRRRAQRVMADLVAQRISHPRAARELRALYDRQKGGWLDAAVRGRATSDPGRLLDAPTDAALPDRLGDLPALPDRSTSRGTP